MATCEPGTDALMWKFVASELIMSSDRTNFDMV